jgi:hypothetical protein
MIGSGHVHSERFAQAQLERSPRNMPDAGIGGANTRWSAPSGSIR